MHERYGHIGTRRGWAHPRHHRLAVLSLQYKIVKPRYAPVLGDSSNQSAVRLLRRHGVQQVAGREEPCGQAVVALGGVEEGTCSCTACHYMATAQL